MVGTFLVGFVWLNLVFCIIVGITLQQKHDWWNLPFYIFLCLGKFLDFLPTTNWCRKVEDQPHSIISSCEREKTPLFPVVKGRKLHYFLLWKGENSIISSCEREKTPLFPFVKGRKLHYFHLWKGENSIISRVSWFSANHELMQKSWRSTSTIFSHYWNGWI
jgi:hypothetical protein